MFRRLAAWLMIGCCVAAPWFVGARSRLSHVPWVFAGTLAASFMLVLFDRLKEGRGPKIPAAAACAAVFLLGCVAWWATHAEPAFATAFAASHWAMLEASNPAGLLQFPRAERLALAAGVLLGLLATVDLGRSESFRRKTGWAIGLSGLSVALYSAGQQWLGWSPPPWVMVAGATEVFDAGFFHYSAAAACINLAWPLVVFRCGFSGGDGHLAKARPTQYLLGALAIGAVAIALPRLGAEAADAVAVGLLAGGLLWWTSTVRTGTLRPALIGTMVAAVFVTAAMWQVARVVDLQRNHPDKWISAEQTRLASPERDAAFQILANRRADRIVESTAPDRPAAWLAAWRMAAAHQTIGPGPGAWVRESALYSDDGFVNSFYLYRQFAHHDLLQTAAEWGAIPMAAWLVLWAGGLRAVLRRRRHGDCSEIALVVALFGIALHSTVDFPLQVPALQIWSAVLLGLAWSGVRAGHVHAPGSQHRRPSM